MSESRGHHPVVGLHGSFQTDNFGDQLLLRIFASWVGQAGGEIAIPFARSSHKAYIDPSLHNGIGRRDVDGYLYFGGGYLGAPRADGSPQLRWILRNLTRHVGPVASAALRRKSLAAIGIGVGPVPRGYGWFARWIGNSAETIVVRDEESRAALEVLLGRESSERVLTAPDAACVAEDFRYEFGSKAPLIRPWDSKRPRIGLHLGPALGNRAVMATAAKLLAELSRNETPEVVLFADGGLGGDLSRFPQPLGLPAVVDHRPYNGIAALLDDLASYDLVVTPKLHVGIVRRSMGLPVIAIGAHPKIQRFYEQSDAPQCCVPPGAPSEVIREAVAAALSGPWGLAPALRADSMALRDHVESFLTRLSRDD